MFLNIQIPVKVHPPYCDQNSKRDDVSIRKEMKYGRMEQRREMSKVIISFFNIYF